MSGNRRIAKNTLFLYGRMLLTMGISLYVSRAILQTLGVEDFGIYNLVGGVVVLFSFLNNAMSASSQRFLNIEIASKGIDNIQRVFSMSLNIHFLIACIVVLLAETGGYWLVNHKLSISPDRLYAANIVFQLSVLTTFVGILKVPYDAIILAYERMSFYAVIGVIQTVVRLGFVLTISLFKDSDKLILYAFFMAILEVLSNVVFFLYCRVNFRNEVHYKYFKDKELFSKLLSFSGWSLLGQMSVVAAGQGIGMILNMFVGVVTNAAIGVAGQISGAVYSFISSAQTAFNPQIVQSFAEKQHERHTELVLRASRFSFFLFGMLCIPFLLGTMQILGLWLGKGYPQYAVPFTRLTLLTAVLTSLAGPLWMSAYAVGNIQRYQLYVSLFNLLILPIAYFLIQYDRNPVIVLTAKLILDGCLLVFRIIYFSRKLTVPKTVLFGYLKNVLPLFVFVFSLVPLTLYFPVENFMDLIKYTICYEAIALILIVLLGMRGSEVTSVRAFVRSKFALQFK